MNPCRMYSLRYMVLRRDISSTRPPGGAWFERAAKGFSTTGASYQNSESQSRPSQEKNKSGNEEIPNNPYYSKYANKIQEAKRQQKNLDKEALAKLEDERERKEREEFVKAAKQLEEKLAKQKQHEESGESGPKKGGLPQNLSDLVKLDLLKGKSRSEIIDIWAEHHKQKECIYAAIPTEYYKHIMLQSKEYPLFVYPLPRENAQQGQGKDNAPSYELILGQFNGHHIHFTPVIAYQTHKENAPVCLTIAHYNELADEKDLVLMLGEFDKNVINVFEAQCLANQVQIYYGTVDSKKKALLHAFNKTPSQFNYMDLISEFEQSTLGKMNKDKLSSFFSDLKID